MNARRKLIRTLGVQRLEDRTVPALLLNELYVNPPGVDDNREFIEIRSTTDGVTSLSGVVLVELDGDTGLTGLIAHDNHLAGLTTGSNGLLLLGQDYATFGTPWGALVPPETALGDRNSFTGNGNLTMLLVTGYTGLPGQDLDTNDDGVLDVTPWTSVLDSVAWFDPSIPGGRVYSTAVLNQPTLTPDAASRFATNANATSAAAWYNGEMLAEGGIPDMTRVYNSIDASANLPTGAVITPGVANLAGPAAPPHVASFAVNDGSAQRSRVTSLTVSFDSTVTFAGAVADAFTLNRNGGGAVTFGASATVVNGVTVVTLNGFTGVETQFGSLQDGRYTLTALASQITVGGQQLNGGANTSFSDAQGLFRFFGDVNGDRRIDIADFGALSATYNKSALDPAFNPIFDFNNDGRIDISDFGQFSVRYFTTLP